MAGVCCAFFALCCLLNPAQTNEGNPVFNATSRTSDLYTTSRLPERFDNPGWKHDVLFVLCLQNPSVYSPKAGHHLMFYVCIAHYYVSEACQHPRIGNTSLIRHLTSLPASHKFDSAPHLSAASPTPLSLSVPMKFSCSKPCHFISTPRYAMHLHAIEKWCGFPRPRFSGSRTTRLL